MCGRSKVRACVCRSKVRVCMCRSKVRVCVCVCGRSKVKVNK